MSAAPPTIYQVSQVRLIEFPHHFEDNGDVVVMECQSHVPFPIVRVFVVRAPAGGVRGQHAHKRCTQLLTCSAGAVEVICDDGAGTSAIVLDRPDLGLLLPPSIWAQQTFRGAGSQLTVLCDRLYEAEDYIRDYVTFQAYRAGTVNSDV